MLYGHGPREQDREQDKGARQGVRWEQDRFAASRSHCSHMVVGTLNSSMVVGTLKFSIKCYMGAWAKRARWSKMEQDKGRDRGQHRGQDREGDRFAPSCSPCPNMVVGTLHSNMSCSLSRSLGPCPHIAFYTGF